MAQPTDQSTGSSAPAREHEETEPLKFTLVIVSPSAGVPNPLTFPHLLATTTIKDLKARIRDAVPSKPADEDQRLIHRGRLLGRELERMEDIFGRDVLANPESQTLHLVLRPVVTDSPAALSDAPLDTPAQRVATSLPLQLPPPPHPQSTSPRPIQTSIPNQNQPGHPNQHLPNLAIQHQPGLPNQYQPGIPIQYQPGLPIQHPPGPPNQHLPGLPNQHTLHGIQQVHNNYQRLSQADQLQNMMTIRLNQLQQETLRLQQEMVNIEQRSRSVVAGAVGITNNNNNTQNPLPPPPLSNRLATAPQPTAQQIIAQQQSNRAADGRQGIQDSSSSPANLQRPNPSYFRPVHTTTTTREGFGPNGERWQVTVNETTTTVPVVQSVAHHHYHHPQAQVVNNNMSDNLQSIIRNADRVMATHPTNIAGETTTVNAAAAGTNESSSSGLATQTQTQNLPFTSSAGIASPATGNNSPAPSILLNQSPNGNNAEGANSTMVYLLSSPEGPRALLLSNGVTYFSPRQSRRPRQDSPSAVHGRAQDHLNQVRLGVPRLRRDVNVNQPAQNEENVMAPRAHGNPGAGALGARIGPIIWLIVRLAGFVWFFTAGNSSWSRFITVSALAIAVFIINTGVFNGIAEQLWSPIRRHVEALIPLAGPEAARIPAANAAILQQPVPAPLAANRPAPRRRRGELNENEVAARLIEQHRQANTGWLMTQIRRAEHAALLFMASLVPGVGERHIAAREAEAVAAEAERQRLIEAAAAAADQETAVIGGRQATNVDQAIGSGEAVSGGHNQDGQPQNVEQVDAPPPLVEV